MRGRGIRLASLLILWGFMLLLAACGGRAGLETEILGKWMDARSQPGDAIYYEFFKDGSVTLEMVGHKKWYAVGAYSFLDSTRIKMWFSDAGPLGNLSGPTKVLSVSISGNETTLVDLDGTTIKLKRINYR